jgi:hypothetical protein
VENREVIKDETEDYELFKKKKLIDTGVAMVFKG